MQFLKYFNIIRFWVPQIFKISRQRNCGHSFLISLLNNSRFCLHFRRIFVPAFPESLRIELILVFSLAALCAYKTSYSPFTFQARGQSCPGWCMHTQTGRGASLAGVSWLNFRNSLNISTEIVFQIRTIFFNCLPDYNSYITSMYFFLNCYLFERVTKWKGGKVGRRGIFQLLPSFPRCLQQPGPGQAKAI